MANQLFCLLCTGAGSDVDVVTADGTVHRLHKFLLAAASPLLAELLKLPEDDADGRTVLRDVFARFPSDHIRVIIAMAYRIEIDIEWDDKFGRFIETKKYRRALSPVCIMAVFETLAYFQVPLPQWLKMHTEGQDGNFLCGSIFGMHGRGHHFGLHTTYRDDDGDSYLQFAHDAKWVANEFTSGGILDYNEETIDMINSYFKSKERTFRSFRIVPTEKKGITDVFVNDTLVETCREHWQVRVDTLCEKWLRLQNRYA